MIGQGNAVSGLQLSDEDYADRLVRVPPHLNAERKTRGASFHDVMKGALETDGGRITHTRDKRDRKDKKLMDACVEMESLLVARMLKEMRHTVHKTGWINGGFAEEIFEDMLYDEYALSLSRNSSLGLSSMLYDELKRRI